MDFAVAGKGKKTLETFTCLPHPSMNSSNSTRNDEGPEKVGMMAAMGVTISEFPVTLDAARASRSLGISTLFGALNVLRDGPGPAP